MFSYRTVQHCHLTQRIYSTVLCCLPAGTLAEPHVSQQSWGVRASPGFCLCKLNVELALTLGLLPLRQAQHAAPPQPAVSAGKLVVQFEDVLSFVVLGVQLDARVLHDMSITIRMTMSIDCTDRQ